MLSWVVVAEFPARRQKKSGMAARGSRGWGRGDAPSHAVSHAPAGAHAHAANFSSDLAQAVASRASFLAQNDEVVPAAEWSSVSDSISDAGDSFRREFGEWIGEQQREREAEQRSLKVPLPVPPTKIRAAQIQQKTRTVPLTQRHVPARIGR